MRLWLLTIISSLFIFTSDSVNAAGIYDNETAIACEYEFSEKGLGKDAGSATGDILILQKIRHRVVTHQHRSITFAPMHNPGLHFSAVAVLTDVTHLPRPDSFCIVIGMKLLFPKHYFW